MHWVIPLVICPVIHSVICPVILPVIPLVIRPIIRPLIRIVIRPVIRLVICPVIRPVICLVICCPVIHRHRRPSYPHSYPSSYLMLPNLINQFIKLSDGNLQCEWNSDIFQGFFKPAHVGLWSISRPTIVMALSYILCLLVTTGFTQKLLIES